MMSMSKMQIDQTTLTWKKGGFHVSYLGAQQIDPETKNHTCSRLERIGVAMPDFRLPGVTELIVLHLRERNTK